MKGERLGELEEVLLLCVRQLGDEAHAPAIQELLAESAGREITLGAIYAALDRSQRKGMADSRMGEPTAERGGRAKRHWSVTQEGEEALRHAREVRTRLWAGEGPAPAEAGG